MLGIEQPDTQQNQAIQATVSDTSNTQTDEESDVETQTDQVQTTSTGPQGLMATIEQYSHQIQAINSVLIFGGLLIAGIRKVNN